MCFFLLYNWNQCVCSDEFCKDDTFTDIESLHLVFVAKGFFFYMVFL